MDAYVEENANAFAQIRIAKDPSLERADEAVAIIKAYLRETKAIIYGGTAMDMALRTKGDFIYADDKAQVPDIDAYCPDAVEVAYTLADKLFAAGFVDARAIHGFKISTMRMDIGDNNFLMDFSHIPPKAFAKIPFLNIDGLNIVHPTYQRMDMHNCLAFPFNNIPREDVFSRWKKDNPRFNKLDASFPIEISKSFKLPPQDTIEVDIASVNQPTIGKLSSIVIHAFAAYSCFYTYLRDNKCKLTNVIPSIASINKSRLQFQSPFPRFDFIQFEDNALPHPQDVERREAYTTLLPPIYEYKDGKVVVCGHVFNTNLLSIHTIPIDNVSISVVSIHLLAKYFLAMSFIKPDDSPIYLSYYKSLIAMIAISANTPIPFNPSLDVVGNENAPETLIIDRERSHTSFDQQSTNIVRQLDADDKDDDAPAIEELDILVAPKSYRPATNQPHPAFDYGVPHFREIGKKIETIKGVKSTKSFTNAKLL